MSKKKKYSYKEVCELMTKKFGKNAPYINETTNYEKGFKYRVYTRHFGTLSQIVDAYKLED